MPFSIRHLLLNTAVTWSMLGLYLCINHFQPPPATIVSMPGWVPFVPALIPIYLSLLLVTWLLPGALTDRNWFRAYMRAQLCAWFLVMPWWILVPTMMPRPPLPDGVWASWFEWLWGSDHPYNVMPCAHGVGPVIAAWFVGVRERRGSWIFPAFVVAGLPSIALVWQHRPIDIFLGTVAAAIGIAAGEMWHGKEMRAIAHPRQNPFPENLKAK